jgi:hypothetical protein
MENGGSLLSIGKRRSANDEWLFLEDVLQCFFNTDDLKQAYYGPPAFPVSHYFADPMAVFADITEG